MTRNKTVTYISGIIALIAVVAFVVSPLALAEMDATGSHIGKYNIKEKLDAYCAMSPEEQAEVIAKHNKSDEMVSKINEYCSLDEEGRAALIAEHKEKFEKHAGMTGMSGDYDASKHAGMTGMSGDYDASKHAEFVKKIQELKQAHANGDLDKVKKLTAELQDLRNQIVEEIRY